MIVCKQCGKLAPKRYNGLCQGCWRYFHLGGEIHPLPAYGTVEYDRAGKVICHICGKSFVRLGSHVIESHGMTIKQYKAEFGLCRRARTTEDNYNKVMRDHALENKMDDQLIRCGAATRIKPGETDRRQGKEIREQERMHKKRREKKGA